MVSRRPVADEIASRFMPTLWLTITSMVLGGDIWYGGGNYRRRLACNRWPDRLSMTIAVSGISFRHLPGDTLIQVFSVELGWLPTVGADSWQPPHFTLPDARRGSGRRDGALKRR